MVRDKEGKRQIKKIKEKDGEQGEKNRKIVTQSQSERKNR